MMILEARVTEDELMAAFAAALAEYEEGTKVSEPTQHKRAVARKAAQEWLAERTVNARDALSAELIEARKVIAAAMKVYSKHMCAGKDGLGCDACRDYERSAAHYRSLYPEGRKLRFL